VPDGNNGGQGTLKHTRAPGKGGRPTKSPVDVRQLRIGFLEAPSTLPLADRAGAVKAANLWECSDCFADFGIDRRC